MTPDLTRWQLVTRLSPREYEVFLLLGDGLTTKEIAAKLHTAQKTIECQCARVKAKLGQPHMSYLRVYAAKFQAFCGRPELSERVFERRLIFKQDQINA